MGKKGMSPIIATILLIAFAVALGAMIMNWSSSLVAGGELAGLCESVSVQVRKPLCRDGNNIRVDIVNNGQTDIAAVILRITGVEAEQNIEIKNSQLPVGQALVRDVSALVPEEFSMELLPMVEVEEGVLETCEETYLASTLELPSCN